MLSKTIILYIGLQFFMVILSTFKSILIVKATPTTAAIVTSFYYTINAVVVKFLTQLDFLIVISVTFITNLLGVAIAKFILTKLEKERFWVFNITLKGNSFDVRKLREILKSSSIKCVYNQIEFNELYEVKIFSTSKEDSRLIKDILKSYRCKYYIIEPT